MNLAYARILLRSAPLFSHRQKSGFLMTRLIYRLLIMLPSSCVYTACHNYAVNTNVAQLCLTVMVYVCCSHRHTAAHTDKAQSIINITKKLRAQHILCSIIM